MELIHARNRWLIASAAVLGFALVYELFSHQVYSAFMLGAFLIPLLGGALPFALLSRMPEKAPGPIGRCLWGSGLAALTAGSLFRGVLEIYGSTNSLGAVYWRIGALLCLAGLAVFLPEKRKQAE